MSVPALGPLETLVRRGRGEVTKRPVRSGVEVQSPHRSWNPQSSGGIQRRVISATTGFQRRPASAPGWSGLSTGSRLVFVEMQDEASAIDVAHHLAVAIEHPMCAIDVTDEPFVLRVPSKLGCPGDFAICVEIDEVVIPFRWQPTPLD